MGTTLKLVNASLIVMLFALVATLIYIVVTPPQRHPVPSVTAAPEREPKVIIECGSLKGIGTIAVEGDSYGYLMQVQCPVSEGT